MTDTDKGSSATASARRGAQDEVPFNPFSDEFSQRRYQVYKKYRDSDPFQWGIPGTEVCSGTWYVLGYSEASEILHDPRFGNVRPVVEGQPSAEIPTAHIPLNRLTKEWLLSIDDPSHRRLRSLFSKVFRAQFDNAMGERIQKVADELVLNLPDSGPFDLLEHFCAPLPSRVICDMIGIPAAYYSNIYGWSKAVFAGVELRKQRLDYSKIVHVAAEVHDLISELMRHKRSRPGNDLISKLVSSKEGMRVDPEMLISNIALLTFAGNITSTDLIANAVFTLQSHPQQLDLLLARPQLYDAAVLEVLRYETPAQATVRYALVDMDFAGKKVHAGDMICILLGAANRDAARFDSPDVFDISRRRVGNIGFGAGAHHCLGFRLGMLETKVALQTLLREVPSISLRCSEPEWRSSVMFRSLRRLPVARN